MKQLIVITLLIAGLYACNKTGDFLYRSPKDSVYFNFDPETTDRDSVIYTFAYFPGISKDTIYLPVSISGLRVAHERTFSVSVVKDGTTAAPNTHYAPFKDTYTIPADSGRLLLPVILYNTDAAMADRSVVLQLKLTPSTELDTANNKLINARIVFSNKLEQPKWWSMWLGNYYSQVKHRLFIIANGPTDLTMEGLDAPRNLFFVDRLKNLLGDPATWVASNPGKGYQLVKRPDGNYDFFSTENPSKTMLYKKNEAAGKYYFIDEAGKEII